jgi:hypothetical protein
MHGLMHKLPCIMLAEPSIPAMYSSSLARNVGWHICSHDRAQLYVCTYHLPVPLVSLSQLCMTDKHFDHEHLYPTGHLQYFRMGAQIERKTLGISDMAPIFDLSSLTFFEG